MHSVTSPFNQANELYSVYFYDYYLFSLTKMLG